jgi:hypothetical protein
VVVSGVIEIGIPGVFVIFKWMGVRVVDHIGEDAGSFVFLFLVIGI